MESDNPTCLGNYDFKHIAFYTVKRFIEGDDTVVLLDQAVSGHEKEEVALVCMLDIENDAIRDIQLSCRYDGQCKVGDCRDRLRNEILKLKNQRQ